MNLIGASTIMALLNLKKSFSIPFIFGGDGACICIPESLVAQAKQALLATKAMAKELCDIELRVAIVPIRFVRERGYNVLVAPCRLSQTFTQAVFYGGGLQFAEECVKNPETESLFALDAGAATPKADFSGLECRWKNVPSAHGEIVTLIVQSLSQDDTAKGETYKEIIRKVNEIYGDDAKCHPLQEQLLTMSLGEKQLAGESNIRSYGKSFLYRLYYWFKIRYGVILGTLLMNVGYTTKKLDWGTYKQRLIANTDFKKFDDKLRQVLSGTARQREQLLEFLEKKFQKNELVYGLHAAPSALVTCVLFNYQDAHVHLVDAENGGYAMAVRQMKERLNSILMKK